MYPGCEVLRNQQPRVPNLPPPMPARLRDLASPLRQPCDVVWIQMADVGISLNLRVWFLLLPTIQTIHVQGQV